MSVDSESREVLAIASSTAVGCSARYRSPASLRCWNEMIRSSSVRPVVSNTTMVCTCSSNSGVSVSFATCSAFSATKTTEPESLTMKCRSPAAVLG